MFVFKNIKLVIENAARTRILKFYKTRTLENINAPYRRKSRWDGVISV